MPNHGGAVLVHFDSLFDLRNVLGIKRLNFCGLYSWLAESVTRKPLVHTPIIATRDGLLDNQSALARDIRAAGFVVTQLDPRVKDARKNPDPLEQGMSRIDLNQCAEIVLLTTCEAHVALVRLLTASGKRVFLVTTEVPCQKRGQWKLASEVAELVEHGKVQLIELSSNIARFCLERMHPAEQKDAQLIASATGPRCATMDFARLGPQQCVQLLGELRRLEERFPGLRFTIRD